MKRGDRIAAEVIGYLDSLTSDSEASLDGAVEYVSHELRDYLNDADIQVVRDVLARELTAAMRPNPARGHDFSEGVRLFIEFHSRSKDEPSRPTKVGDFAAGFKIPSEVGLAGDADWVSYRSTKWKENADYIHEHEHGVKCYRVGHDWGGVTVPGWITSVKTLVRLGHCLGFSYVVGDFDEKQHLLRGENVEAKMRAPLPELYCIPSGRALLVISGKKRVDAMMWGGHLDVTKRGIVG